MKKTTKEAVIECLLNESGLDLTSINEKLKKDQFGSYGYHSVYKALKQLVDDNVLIKGGNIYSISDDWIKKKVNFSDRLKAHLNKLSNINHDCNDSSLVEFRDIKDLHKFLRNLEIKHLDVLDKAGNGTIVWVVYHYYNYLLHPAKELGFLKKLKECGVEFKILCYGNTPLDIWTKKAFEKYGVVMKTGCKVGGITGLNIYDDMVTEIYYGKEFLDVLNDVYQNTPSINDFDLSALFYRLSKINYKINVALYKNKNIIKCLKERALGLF